MEVCNKEKRDLGQQEQNQIHMCEYVSITKECDWGNQIGGVSTSLAVGKRRSWSK